MKGQIHTILCYGDSNTYGYDPETGERYPRDVRWPGRLQILLGDDFHIVEEGCNGRTTVYDDPIDGWKNGLDYLKPCLNSHKPVDIIILMLGTNDLKETFHLTADKIAAGAGQLVDVIRTFTSEKQGYIPQIMLVSPPEIGRDIRHSYFSNKFSEDAIEESKRFPACYRQIAEEKGCVFFNAAAYVSPSDTDSIHLTAEGHIALAQKLSEMIRDI